MKKIMVSLSILALILALLIGSVTIMAMPRKDSHTDIKNEKNIDLTENPTAAENEQTNTEAAKELEEILENHEPPKVEFTNEALEKVIAEHPNYRNHKGSFPEEVGTDREWYDALQKIVADESLERYADPDIGPVNYLAYDINGYIAIHYTEEIDKDAERCKELDEEIYNSIIEIANKYGIEDVPVIFEHYNELTLF